MFRYECHVCGKKFENPDFIEEKHGLDSPPYEKTAVCPYCHGYFENMQKCEICGEYFCEDEIEWGVCNDCVEKNLTVDNCYRWGKDCKEKFEINGFLRAVYSDNDIERLLLKNFVEMCLHPKLVCRSFMDTDYSWFADKIKEDKRNGESF